MITTHVLDLASGRPAAGVAVVLEGREADGWGERARAVTDAEGRVREFPCAGGEGEFRLRFDTGAYLGADAFFPEVALHFRVAAEADHVHVPLLLSPFGYSTYRGS
jgi:5-hydroxyisourate hydrolase